MSIQENTNPTPSNFYYTEGTLRRGAPSYVERQADADLFNSLMDGQLCYVLTSRQMGKSSLMVRTAVRLRENGVTVAVLDLTAIGQNVTPEQWYQGLLELIWEQHPDLEEELEDFWQEQKDLSPLQRWMTAIREVFMTRRSGPIVIFVDEIDAVRSLPFPTDEFFAGIREFYNRRTENPEVERLIFCLLGVATPSDLISDTRMTPFNIGRRIELKDFTESEAAPLIRGLGREERSGRELLKRIYYWTGGHPYLTQRFCQAVAEDASVKNAGGVDRVCETLFLSSRARVQDDNLMFVSKRLLMSKDADRASLLDLYARVRKGKGERDDETNPLMSVLRLSGIARSINGFLQVRNRIYHRVFDKAWLIANMPDAELQRQRAAYRKGLVRAAAVAAIILSVMAGLALAAVRERRRATKSESEARATAQRLEKVVAQLEEEKKRLIAQEMMTKAESERAEKEKENAEKEKKGAEESAEQARRAEEAANANAKQAREQTELARKETARAETATRDANNSAKVAQERVLKLYEEQGRQELLRGDKLRALPYLSQAYIGGSNPVLRFLLAGALSQVRAERAIFEGHTSQVSLANFSPDGRRVVTNSSDGTAKVWDVDTGSLLFSLDKHLDAVTRAIFSPDGNNILTTSSDSTAIIWNLSSRDNGVLSAHAQKYLILRGHIGAVNSAAFSPDGKQILTAGSDGTIRTWDAESGKLTRTLEGHDGEIWSVEFSLDGKRIVTASSDKTAKIWDAVTCKPLFTLNDKNASKGQILVAQFDASGDRVATMSDDDIVNLWDAASGKLLFSFKGRGKESPFNSIAFSPDSAKILAADAGSTLTLWSASKGTALFSIETKQRSINYAAFSPNGAYIITAGADGSAKIWDADNGNLLAALDAHTNQLTYASFSQDGEYLITTSQDNTAKIWSVSEMRLPRVLNLHSDELEVVAFSPDGTRAVTGSRDNTARLWDAVTSKPIGEPMRHKGWVIHAEFSIHPTNFKLLTVGGNEVKIWNGMDGAAILTIKSDKSFVSANFSPDGKQLVTADSGGFWIRWDAQTGKELKRASFNPNSFDKLYSAVFHPEGGYILTIGSYWAEGGETFAELWKGWNGIRQFRYDPEDVQCAAFSPDGRSIVIGERNGDAVISTIIGSNQTRTLKRDESDNPKVLSVAFSHDSKRIVTTYADGKAIIWEAESGFLVASLIGHQGAVKSASFSLDDSLIVTASSDGTAKVWDAATGNLISSLNNHSGAVKSAVFSPDKTKLRIITASSDTRAKIWDVQPESKDAFSVASLVNSRVPFHLDQGQLQQGSMRDANLAYGLNGNLLNPPRSEIEIPRVQLAGKYEEEGRRSLLEGDWVNAVARLNQAYQLGADWPSIQFLLRRAERQFDGLKAILWGHKGEINHLEFSPDGKRIVTVSLDKTARIWDLDTGRLVTVLKGHTDWAFSAAFSPDSTRVVTASRDGTARVWDATTGNELLVINPDEARAQDAKDGKLNDDLKDERQINDAFYSNDGKFIVTDCDDGIVRLWDAQTGRLIKSFGPHKAGIIKVALTLDGKRLAAGCRDGEVALWDVSSGRVTRIGGHKLIVNNLSFNKNGSHLLVASNDSKTALYDSQTGSLIREFPQQYLAEFSPDGRRVMTAGGDRTAWVWDIAQEQPLFPLSGHRNFINSAAFSGDGKRIITGSGDRSAKLWDASNGELIASFEGHTNNDTIAAISPDNKLVVTASGETTRIWYAAPITSSDQQFKLPDGNSPSSFVQTSTSLLVLTTNGEQVTVSDIGNGKEVASFAADTVTYFGSEGKPAINSLLVLPEIGGAAQANNDASDILGDDEVSDGEEKKNEKAPPSTPEDNNSKPGQPIAKRISDKEMAYVVDRLTTSLSRLPGLAVKPQSEVSNYTGPAQSPEEIGRALNVQAVLILKSKTKPKKVSTGGIDADNTLKESTIDELTVTATILDVRSKGLIWSKDYIRTQKNVREVYEDIAQDIAQSRRSIAASALSQDGRLVVTGTADGAVKIWDIVGGRQLGVLVEKGEGINFITFSSDAKLVATIDNAQKVKVWNLANVSESREIPNDHTERILFIAFSPDGTRLVTTSEDQTAKIWNIADGKLSKLLSGHTGSILSAQFSNDGRRIVTTSEDQTAKIWDAETGKLITTLIDHTRSVNYASFTQDVAFVVTVSDDASACLWDVSTGKLLYRFNEHASPIYYAKFDRDDQRVLTASDDGSIWVWDVGRKTRSREDINKLVRRFIPFALSAQGELIPFAEADSEVMKNRQSSMSLNQR